MIRFHHFPKQASILKRVISKGHNKLFLKHNVIVTSLSGTRKNWGWEVSKEKPDVAIVTVGKETLKHDIKANWPRGALHELCHIKLWEMFGSDWLDTIASSYGKSGKSTTHFGHFLIAMGPIHTSPRGFNEFLTDEIYLTKFQEPVLRGWYMPQTTGTVKTAFDTLCKRRRRDMRAFSDLFYLWRVDYCARKYNEPRPIYLKWINRLREYKRYGPTIKKLDKLFNKWHLPKNRKPLENTIAKLYKISRSFVDV